MDISFIETQKSFQALQSSRISIDQCLIKKLVTPNLLAGALQLVFKVKKMRGHHCVFQAARLAVEQQCGRRFQVRQACMFSGLLNCLAVFSYALCISPFNPQCARPVMFCCFWAALGAYTVLLCPKVEGKQSALQVTQVCNYL